MRKRILFALTILVSVLQFHILSAQTKQNFFKRTWVNTVARYNYYYNANERVKEAERSAVLAHIDNFNEIVHLYPFSDQASLKGNLPRMDESVKKCNHIITRRQSSKWVDDSWVLIGKANFFKGDFFAALEAFEYVATTYKAQPIRYDAEIWIIKTLIMLEKYDEAVALSDLMLADKQFPKKLKKELYLVSAEGLIFQKKYPLAYERLKKVMPDLKRKDYRYRRNFVAGQLAILNKQPEEAIKYFSKVTKSNPPYEFDFFARINMVRMYTQEPVNNVRKGRSILTRMLRDDKNLDYLDQIYYELGMLDLKQGNRQGALVNFRKALASSKNNVALKSNIYLLTAELYFENANYENAQKYYDSAVQVLSPSSPDFDEISTRHQVLTELITNLVNISYQDSMLRLARDADFRKSTLNRIKEEERKRKEEEEYRKNNPFDNPMFTDPMTGSGMPGGMQGQTADSRFPFYNQQLKVKGEGDFIQIWGNRELGDFWRVQSIAQTEKREEPTETEQTEKSEDGEEEEEEKKGTEPLKLPGDIKEEDAQYFASVPFDPEQQREAEYRMGESYFLAGNIYREKLLEPQKAKELLEIFLSKLKDNPYRENTLYLLIKIYEEEGDINKVRHLKSQLTNEFPDSDFIQILENPEMFREGKTVTSPEQVVSARYILFYNAYKENRYEEAKEIYNTVKKDYPGNSLDGQFDFVYALILADQKKLKEYYNIMVSLAGNYSGTPLGDLAEERVRAYTRLTQGEDGKNEQIASGTKPAAKVYPYQKSEEKEEHHFIIRLTRNMDANLVKIAFSDFNRDFRPDQGLQVTTSFLGTSTRILLVTGFQTQTEAKKYIEDVLLNTKLLQALKTEPDKKDFLFISKDNFSLLLKEKVWEEYQEYFGKTYL